MQLKYLAHQLQNTLFKTSWDCGDTASFTKVVESQPYGDELNPVKLECVGHYQKRTGNGSQHNRKDLKG